MQYKIDEQLAEEEFVKICEDWEIDIDESNMDSEEKIDFKSVKVKVIKAIRLGRLVYNSDGTIIYTLSKHSIDFVGTELTIKVPDGVAYTDMDQFKKDKDMHKTFTILSYMIGKPLPVINKLDGRDLKPLLALASLFLAD